MGLGARALGRGLVVACVATSGIGTFSTSAAAAPQTMEYACSVLGQLVSLGFTIDGSAPASIKAGDALTYSVSVGFDTDAIPTTLAGAGFVGMQGSRLAFTVPDGTAFHGLTGAPAAAKTPAAGGAGDVVIPLADPLSRASADQAISFGLQLETSAATPGSELVLAAPNFSTEVLLDLSSVGGPSASVQVAECVAPKGAQVASVAVRAADATTTTTTTTAVTTTTSTAVTTTSTTTLTAASTATARVAMSSSTTSTSVADTLASTSAATSLATDSSIAPTTAVTTSVAAGDSGLPAHTRTTTPDASATTAPPSPAFTGSSNWLVLAALALVLSGLLAVRIAPWGVAGKRSACRR